MGKNKNKAEEAEAEAAADAAADAVAKAGEKGGKNSSYIQWHPAFIEALQLELKDYKGVLELYPEVQLTTGPLKIDCVVVKKTSGVKIKKNIAAIFKTWNLVEYKSPSGDYVSIENFYKVYGYACFYAYLNKIPITDLTITFIESRYPRKLVSHLKNVRKFTVAETSKGIYTVSGDIIPMQIIISRKLSADDNLWLKSLSDRLDSSEVMRIGAILAKQAKTVNVNAYWDAVARANDKVTQEAFKMLKVPESYVETFKKIGWIDKWRAEGKKQADKKWQTVVTKKDAQIAKKEAENSRLREQLEFYKKRELVSC